MRVTAISDIHGDLPQIEPTDLLLIAGDWSPLEIQTNYQYMKEWFGDVFMQWMKDVPADKIIFIAGNHDFICDPLYVYPYSFQVDILDPLLRKYKQTKKVKYLENSYSRYKGYKIYGCPYVEGCRGWAFCLANLHKYYKNIPKCDILLTHQPPLFNSVGATIVENTPIELGSFDLLQAITKVNPSYHFFGHVHGGNHNPSKYNNSMLYNCALKNEDYEIAFRPQIVYVPDKENQTC